jgi:ubiquinone biosynthesis protein Coq4
MQLQVNIQDGVWDEFTELGLKTKDVDKITEEAIKKYIAMMKNYKRLLNLKGKVEWEGDIDEMRSSRL